MNRHERLGTTSRIILASAVYDLVVTVPFATPWTAGWIISWLHGLHATLGLPGAPPPDFGPMHLFFVSLFGTIVSLWSVMRILRPEPLLGTVDTAGRALFSLWMAHALLLGQTRILAVMLVLELTWFFVQGGAILRGRKPHAPSQLVPAS